MTFLSSVLWSVFTKPWSRLPGEELGKLVAGLGFSGAEVPVRDTAHVTPAVAERLLPAFAAQLRAEGVEVISVASDLDEPVFAACGAAGVPMIRVMAELGPDGYAASVRRVRQRLEAAAPLAERYGVRVGVQPHHGRFVSSALGVMDLLDGLPVEHFRVVWDAAHDALAGDDPRVTLPLVAGRLGIVNLKNATYVATDAGSGSGGGSVGGNWKPWFVPGAEGLANWSAALGQLAELGYAGPVCLSGQYSDPGVPVEERLKADLAAARGA
ncbi:sugar phosphate isomerase/epimerase family protein [Streptomyces sp. NPDC005962]|uniref:sugar phosphate isomerase/epimerase family protein n=1 Tax=Streptomyces sp. NPDC005962 TaxID=3154466 RepID=UPI0033EFE7AD